MSQKLRIVQWQELSPRQRESIERLQAEARKELLGGVTWRDRVSGAFFRFKSQSPFYAFKGSKAVGMVNLFDYKTKKPALHVFYVSKPFRKKGIGTALVNKVLAKLLDARMHDFELGGQVRVQLTDLAPGSVAILEREWKGLAGEAAKGESKEKPLAGTLYQKRFTFTGRPSYELVVRKAGQPERVSRFRKLAWKRR